MLCKPALHGNSDALSLARRALKDKFPTPTIPLTTVLQNRQLFLPDPVGPTYKESFQVRWDNSIPLFLHAAIYLEVSLSR